MPEAGFLAKMFPLRRASAGKNIKALDLWIFKEDSEAVEKVKSEKI
jgi:hypothetical protein